MLPNDFIVIAQMHKVYVNGEVKNAGTLSLRKRPHDAQSHHHGGGFTDKAAVGRTKILRIVDGEEQSLRVTLDAQVLPEDIVVVPRSFF